ncbi:MAG: hypothetical protein WB660_08110 [Candidatus Sulfotelmatobacter sp.]
MTKIPTNYTIYPSAIPSGAVLFFNQISATFFPIINRASPNKHPQNGALAMAVNTTAAYGIYSHDVPLADIVHTLNQAGFENEDICMMVSPTHPIASIVREASLFSSERDDSSDSAGMIGWLSAFGAVLIPTVGFFIRSQAFLHALMAARGAPALCGNARTLVGLGFSEVEAEKYENQLRHLGVLVYISCSESAKTLWAQEVLRHTGAHETATLEEKLEEVMTMTMSVAASA